MAHCEPAPKAADDFVDRVFNSPRRSTTFIWNDMTTIKRTIRRTEVLAKTGLSKTSIYNLERAGDFPKHFMLSPRVAVWDEAAVDGWLDARRQSPLPSAVGPDQSRRQSRPGRGRAVAAPWGSA